MEITKGNNAATTRIFIIGDNAYPLSDSVLVPLARLQFLAKTIAVSNRSDIRVAVANLQTSLVVDFVNMKKVIKTCMMLHNFCTDERTKNKTHVRTYIRSILNTITYPKPGVTSPTIPMTRPPCVLMLKVAFFVKSS
ncbi:LOW QUALITY PROTEIN: Hypothetical protein PHPALM_1762 [Phytophthora palmivora]|uniref:DDE Tnp4 domain-containing protein n=1 Tax=Phytophthora palmivora TaxID=4796 RepID=A0A2P4YRI1_9STRA|nr:LOW QUALITY PROTEIN: Hypothetical protein PHPALM_1762 [Phytophthora palmivora]